MSISFELTPLKLFIIILYMGTIKRNKYMIILLGAVRHTLVIGSKVVLCTGRNIIIYRMHTVGKFLF